jgi:hypothetical protein
MNCQDIAHILDEREVESLLAERRSDVQAHLATCHDCARDWQIHSQLVGVTVPAVPDALRAQFSPQWVAASRDGRKRRNGLVVIGALVALAAAAATLLVQKSDPAPSVAAIKDSAQTEPLVTEVSSDARSSPATPVAEADSNAKKELEEWTRGVAAWLSARDDADALVTAALLANSEAGYDEQKMVPLLKRATEKAPDSARIQAVAMMLCFAFQPCDTAPYERALRKIAPENALGWVLHALRASRAGDQEALRSALAQMSRAKTYDLYENAGLVATVSQFRNALVPFPHTKGSSQAVSRDRFALGVYWDLSVFHFTAIEKFCKSATEDEVLAQCHQVGAAMRAGDTSLINLAGISISRHGLPADSAEARSLAQQERQMRWIHAREDEIMRAENPDYPAQFPPRLLGIMADHPRAMDVYRTVLEEHGIPTEPPSDWKCDDCGRGWSH